FYLYEFPRRPRWVLASTAWPRPLDPVSGLSDVGPGDVLPVVSAEGSGLLVSAGASEPWSWNGRGFAPAQQGFPAVRALLAAERPYAQRLRAAQVAFFDAPAAAPRAGSPCNDAARVRWAQRLAGVLVEAGRPRDRARATASAAMELQSCPSSSVWTR